MSDIETWAVRGAVSAAVAAVAGLFLRVRTNEGRLQVAEKTLSRLEAVEKEFSEMKVLNARIIERLDHLPTQSDLQLLHDRISRNGDGVNGVAQQMAGMNEALSGVRQSVDRLHALELAREQK